MTQDKTVKILYLVNNLDFLVSHRLNIIKAARAQGMAVHIVGPPSKVAARFLQMGCHFYPWALSRKSINPWHALNSIHRLLKIYRNVKPDLVHLVSIKPVIYGGIAARLVRVPSCVYAITGLGASYIAESVFAKMVRFIIQFGFKRVCKHKKSVFIFQNSDDQALFIQRKLTRQQQARIIYGSGVCMTSYQPLPLPTTEAWTLVLAARLLRDKGVVEFVQAAELLRQRIPALRFVLVGDVDPDNPASLTTQQVQQWVDAGIVEWWGFQADMQAVFAECHAVCLPSYREGSPRVLIEAAASARPLITTDVPGCRDLVKPGVNGYLVPVKNAQALAAAIERLFAHPEQLPVMAAASRKLVQQRYSEQEVLQATFGLYRELLTT